MVAVLVVVGRGVGAADVFVVVVVVAARSATVIATGSRFLVEASAVVADVAEIGGWGVGGVGVVGVVSWLRVGVVGVVSRLGVAGLVDVALGLALAVIWVRHARS